MQYENIILYLHRCYGVTRTKDKEKVTDYRILELKDMKAKVVIAQATNETAGSLYELVGKFQKRTSIKAYPSVDNEAVFFPNDKHDLSFLKSVLEDKAFPFRVENAE